MKAYIYLFIQQFTFALLTEGMLTGSSETIKYSLSFQGVRFNKNIYINKNILTYIY